MEQGQHWIPGSLRLSSRTNNADRPLYSGPSVHHPRVRVRRRVPGEVQDNSGRTQHLHLLRRPASTSLLDHLDGTCHNRRELARAVHSRRTGLLTERHDLLCGTSRPTQVTESRSHSTGATFGNLGFSGNPIAVSTVGPEAALPAALLHLVNSLLFMSGYPPGKNCQHRQAPRRGGRPLVRPRLALHAFPSRSTDFRAEPDGGRHRSRAAREHHAAPHATRTQLKCRRTRPGGSADSAVLRGTGPARRLGRRPRGLRAQA